MRWKIETFHKILKSGCRADDSRLRTAERLTNLIAIYCSVSWRIFWMTLLNRADPDGSAELAFTDRRLRRWTSSNLTRRAGFSDRRRYLATSHSWRSSAGTWRATTTRRRATR
jgi:hypothetical protein